MELSVQVPEVCAAEIDYTLSVLLGDFLGLTYRVERGSGAGISLVAGGKRLDLPATFFHIAAQSWLQAGSLPNQPLARWDCHELCPALGATGTDVPVIFGNPSGVVAPERIELGLDVIGSAFFLLSRYEEAVREDRDHHDRFPASASLMHQEALLDRPIVNEYLEILWACITSLWPGLERKRHDFRLRITADADQPYCSGLKNPLRLVKKIGGDLLKRKNPRRAAATAANFFVSRFGNFSFDPFLTRFDWMMDVNEAAGNTMTVYFIAGHSDARFDGCYSLQEPVIRKLMRRIHERGHHIGLHGSYHTYRDGQRMRQEADALREALEQEGVPSDGLGARQHYLRWATLATARHMAEAGLAHDSSLTFADHAGFRAGTCFEFQLYDLEGRTPLDLRERPLVVMEWSIIDTQYMGLGYTAESLAEMRRFREVCRQYGGDFTLVWHNSSFENEWCESAYRELLKG
ncbi:MAG: polysaccharide deacetylase family protein [Planctomycetes bacterium]|nr:polysaccharide deacetylase family protein [Planctomycetota bacterium]